MYNSRPLKGQKMKQPRPVPGRMYAGGTPYFNEKTGQYLPGHGPERMYPRGNFDEQLTTQPVTAPMPEQMSRPSEERAQQYNSDYNNMGFDQLLQLLARYRMRGGF